MLDVIADISSSGIMGAYETLLVILQPNQQPVEKTEVTKIIQRTETMTEPNDYLFTGWLNAYCEGEGDAKICWESEETKQQGWDFGLCNAIGFCRVDIGDNHAEYIGFRNLINTSLIADDGAIDVVMSHLNNE